jgi:hypothetical protein
VNHHIIPGNTFFPHVNTHLSEIISHEAKANNTGLYAEIDNACQISIGSLFVVRWLQANLGQSGMTFGSWYSPLIELIDEKPASESACSW